ncbi:MAG: hypothetical protein ACRETC_00070 [Gammaproteobacteria bacterium]
MRYVFMSAILLVLSGIQPAFAGNASNRSSTAGATAIVEKGFSAYQSSGSLAAVKAWLKGSPIATGTAVLKQASNTFNTFETFYGSYQGYKIVGSHSLSGRTEMILVTINYETGPVFGWFMAYQTAKKNWVIDLYKFYTDPNQAWPDDLIYGQ